MKKFEYVGILGYEPIIEKVGRDEIKVIGYKDNNGKVDKTFERFMRSVMTSKVNWKFKKKIKDVSFQKKI